jgi:hypothetical protein
VIWRSSTSQFQQAPTPTADWGRGHAPSIPFSCSERMVNQFICHMQP